MKLKTLFTKVENANEITLQLTNKGNAFAIAVEIDGAFIENKYAHSSTYFTNWKTFIKCLREDYIDEIEEFLRCAEFVQGTETSYYLEESNVAINVYLVQN